VSVRAVPYVDITYKILLTTVLDAWGSNRTSTNSGEKAVETGFSREVECAKGERRIRAGEERDYNMVS